MPTKKQTPKKPVKKVQPAPKPMPKKTKRGGY